ncbi:MAG: hypothetical protein GXY67_10170, partial [Clostridiales bacterium]|nr:hypothetical protein [Clostridiales bacterium]
MKEFLRAAAWALVFILALTGMVGGAETAESETYTYGDFAYTLNADGTVVITRYHGKASSLSVPEALGGHRVTGIGDGAFS